MRLLRAAAWRVLISAATLLCVTAVVFALLHLAPGDALDAAEESRVPRAQVDALRAQLHLDDPPLRRYGLWLRDLLHGDLGRSFATGRPVRVAIGERLGLTLGLNAAALALVLALAVPLGAAAAWRQGSALDRWTGLLSYGLYALPVFWAALVLQIVFAVRLEWLPLFGPAPSAARAVGGWTAVRASLAHGVLPVLCLSYPGLAYLSRFVRGTLAEALGADAARAARARGAGGPAAELGHAFRIAAVPMLTMLGFLLPGLVGGSVLVETIFALPGLGQLLVQAVAGRDVPVVLGLTLLSGTAVLAGVLLSDLAALAVDPRLRRA
ncbi:MAG TPA: ABC transporter permease [Candidatus Polarisedimenticolaceae bacterium]|nr:ABC transporter permease [Candidatus Polarisedimenticolaceae bacterium]